MRGRDEERGDGADESFVLLDSQSSCGMIGWTSRRRMTTSMLLMWMVMAGVDVSIGESCCFGRHAGAELEDERADFEFRSFHSLMSSNSLVLKSTIFPEWYQDHIQAWLQCVSLVSPPAELELTLLRSQQLRPHRHRLLRPLEHHGLLPWRPGWTRSSR